MLHTAVQYWGDIDEQKLVNTNVVSVRGGKIKDIKDRLISDAINYNNLFLLVGGNDCNSKSDQPTTEAIVDDYRELIKEAKKVAGAVHVGSILPRGKQEPGVTERIDSVNAALVTLCDDENVTYVDHDDNFKLRSGTQHKSYFKDDLIHPNPDGVLAIVTAFEINIKPKNAGHVTKSPKHAAAAKKPYQQKKPTSQRLNGPSQLSEFSPTQNTQNRHVAPQRSNPPSSEHSNVSPQWITKQRPHPRASGASPHRHLDKIKQSQGKGRVNYTRRPPTSVNSAYNRHLNTGNVTNQGRPRTQQTCGFCNERNHKEDNCTHGEPIVCDDCGLLGHKAKHHTHHNKLY